MPTASIVASGFVRQARAVARALGAENIAVAEYPGVPMIDSPVELRRKVQEVVVNSVIEGLTRPAKDSVKIAEPGPRDIVFKGTLEEVQDFFYRSLWTDGLPMMPPTIDRVEKFLRFSDRSPEEVIGVLLPENRQATVWNVAVNGVMAGCRPEYMPVLVAVVKAMAEPDFRIEDGGSTPGWEPLIVLNGPIIKELDFNYGSGVMRVGRQANTAIGRFLRLYMRNIPGLRMPPGDTDKGSIAQSFNVVLAEDADAVSELGWQTFGVDQGFKAGDNVATVMSVASISPPIYSGGHTARDHMETIAELIGCSLAYWTNMAAQVGRFHPLLVLSPSVARVIARDGWSKDDVRKYLYDNVRMPAGKLERLHAGLNRCSFCEEVERGVIPEDFCLSKDADRMVPLFLRPEWINIAVSGDPGRNQSRAYVQNHRQGPPTSKKIDLPPNWHRLLG
ncbi:MAG: hypothetical protein HYX92_03200 [Chloroflexi bacterium]|nr:hypothetical protein [Chloroflexota bacterium]